MNPSSQPSAGSSNRVPKLRIRVRFPSSAPHHQRSSTAVHYGVIDRKGARRRPDAIIEHMTDLAALLHARPSRFAPGRRAWASRYSGFGRILG
jgi:hypothetical protein